MRERDVGASFFALVCLMSLLSASSAASAQDMRRSGFEDMSSATQAMQRDDMQNPGMLSVAEGRAVWSTPAGPDGRRCSDCHGDATQSMRGVAARYPSYDLAHGGVITLGARIDRCRSRHRDQKTAGPDDPVRLALELFVAHQSRGMPYAPPDDPRLAIHRARGETLYRTPFGQLGLSCAQCHDDRAGLRLGASPIPQAHPTGYPIYRLEWQTIGSLQRRLRNCMVGVRATPFGADSLEATDLEAYLVFRAKGMSIEAPAVRP